MSSKRKHSKAPAGAVASYIHAGGRIGVLVEVICESDFVARSADFQELTHDLALQIAATAPRFIRREEVTVEAYTREKEIWFSQAKASGKPPDVIAKIVEGKMSRFYEKVCLNDQPFIKDRAISIAQLVASKSEKLGEKIVIWRFSRFNVEEMPASFPDDQSHPDGGDASEVRVPRPKGPKSGRGSAAAKLDNEST